MLHETVHNKIKNGVYIKAFGKLKMAYNGVLLNTG